MKQRKASARREEQAAQNQGMRLRTRLLGAAMALLCFGVLAGRLYWLQVVQHDLYAQRAENQQLRSTRIPAPRGEILDRSGQTLATSATCWTVRAAPREMEAEDVDAASRTLAEILDLDEETVREKLSQRTSNDALLRRRVDKALADQVRDACTANGWKGIYLNEDTQRVYPMGNFAGSILGFTNVDNEGMAGLELKYNKALTGRSGQVLTLKNAWGYTTPVQYDTYVPPVPGNTLTLTIDANIQHYLENYLSYAVQEYNVAARGVGIVMDVNTGAVLAMSTKPDYDPNHPRALTDETARNEVEQLEGEARSKALQLAQQTQWRNKAVSDLYEPGSVFKLITASAALDAGAVQVSSGFYCGESINVAGTRFHCANHRHHGSQDLTHALMNSCNQAFIQVGARLGKQAFCDYFEAFGLRGATGIDLPAEPKKSEYYTADRMGPVELASCSFGQSSKITPIQMATAVAAVVNGGKRMQPYLVERITDAEGRLVHETTPTVVRQVISEKTSAAMRTMMEQVVLQGGGKNAYVAGFRVGGKSGTSQKLDSADEHARIASFVGVAPINDPRVVVLVCLDEPHTFSTAGGTLSAPVVASVLADTLDYLGVPRQYTEQETKTLEAVLPDVTGQPPAAAKARLEEHGFGAKILGDGERVWEQTPRSGQTLARGSTVVLYTEEGVNAVQITVPSVLGQTAQQAEATLAAAGLNLKRAGVPLQAGTVAVRQSAPAGTTLPAGGTVEAAFYDWSLPED